MVQVTLRLYDSSGLLQRTTGAGMAAAPLAGFSTSQEPYDPSQGPLGLSEGTWSFAFDGRDDQGEVLRNGAYVIELVSDLGGTLTTVRKTIQVVGAGAPMVELMAGPNPLRSGQGDLVIRWTPAVPVDLKIYNLNGELVRDLGRCSKGPELWDLRSDAGGLMADGVYWVAARRPGERLPRLFKLMVAR